MSHEHHLLRLVISSQAQGAHREADRAGREPPRQGQDAEQGGHLDRQSHEEEIKVFCDRYCANVTSLKSSLSAAVGLERHICISPW